MHSNDKGKIRANPRPHEFMDRGLQDSRPNIQQQQTALPLISPALYSAPRRGPLRTILARVLRWRFSRRKGRTELGVSGTEEGTSHDFPVHPTRQQQDPNQQAGTSLSAQPRPSNPPGDKASGDFFAGPTDKVEIAGSTIHHTLGNYTVQNVTIHHVNSERREAEQDTSHQYTGAVPIIIEELSGLLSTEPGERHNNAQQHLLPLSLLPSQTSHHNSAAPNAQGLTTSITIYSPDSSNNIYERHLLLKKKGFPLWIPEPNRTLPMPYRRDGVSIGDVGIITTSGAFSFLFNICLPHDDPINPSVLPDGFVPISIEPRDIREYSEFKRNNYLASAAIRTTKTHDDPPFRGLSFETSSTEGAILTFPEGAIARELANVSRFRQYIKANLEEWYRYINGPLGCEVQNGEVRLVTGCVKATSWGVAAFTNLSPGQETQYLKYCSIEDGGVANAPIPLYKWEYTGLADAKVGPDLEEIEDLKRDDGSDMASGATYQNQCLFISTLNPMLGDDVFEKISRELESALTQDSQQSHTGGTRSTTSSPPNSGALASSTGSQIGADSAIPPGSASRSSGAASQELVIANITKERVTMSRSPTAPLSHPAQVLNKQLLQKFPKSRVVITQDEDWCHVINEDDQIMPSSVEIAERVFATNHIREDDGLVFFELMAEQQSILPRQQPPSRSTKDHSRLLSPKSSTSSASSEWKSVATPELRISTLDTTGLSVANDPSPILLDEKELFGRINAQDIIIAVMGPSGTGKSSFINTLLGAEVAATSDALFSCTQQVRAYGCLRAGRRDQKVIIIDTPGFDDTHRTDYEVLEEIANWLEKTYSKHIKLSGLLYFHSIRESRMRVIRQRNFGMFQRLCGPKALKNVVLLSTFWDELESADIGAARERQLSERFWRSLIDRGSRIERFDPRSYQRAWEIVDRFSLTTGIPLAIQVEMVDERKKLPETSAFRFLVQWWTEFVNKLREFSKNTSAHQAPKRRRDARNASH